MQQSKQHRKFEADGENYIQTGIFCCGHETIHMHTQPTSALDSLHDPTVLQTKGMQI